jgi:Fe-S cluster biogenesis protein NfuA
MFIQTEATPNPATIKFIPGVTVMPSGTADFRSLDEAIGKSPLAERLFALEGVEGVFFGHDFVSITKQDAKDWTQLKTLILGTLFEAFSNNEPVCIEQQQTQANFDNAEDAEIIAEIEDLLETRVRPAVAQDGGDVVFHRFEKGILYLEMRGACSGCPSSAQTLKHGIESMMRHYIPEVLEVREAQSSLNPQRSLHP